MPPGIPPGMMPPPGYPFPPGYPGQRLDVPPAKTGRTAFWSSIEEFKQASRDWLQNFRTTIWHGTSQGSTSDWLLKVDFTWVYFRSCSFSMPSTAYRRRRIKRKTRTKTSARLSLAAWQEAKLTTCSSGKKRSGSEKAAQAARALQIQQVL